jgi:hypothetical protein
LVASVGKLRASRLRSSKNVAVTAGCVIFIESRYWRNMWQKHLTHVNATTHSPGGRPLTGEVKTRMIEPDGLYEPLCVHKTPFRTV